MKDERPSPRKFIIQLILNGCMVVRRCSERAALLYGVVSYQILR